MPLNNFRQQLPESKKKPLWPISLVLITSLATLPHAFATAANVYAVYKIRSTDTVRVKGTIQMVDAQTGKTENVPSVIIRIKETQSAVVTNGNGDFRFSYVPGRDTITLIIADPLFDKTQIMLTNVHLQDEIDLGKILLKQAPPSLPERESKRSKRSRKD